MFYLVWGPYSWAWLFLLLYYHISKMLTGRQMVDVYKTWVVVYRCWVVDGAGSRCKVSVLWDMTDIRDGEKECDNLIMDDVQHNIFLIRAQRSAMAKGKRPSIWRWEDLRGFRWRRDYALFVSRESLSLKCCFNVLPYIH